MDIGDRGLYNDLSEEVDEFIVEPNALVEVGETTLSDGLCPFGYQYHVAHCTTRTACHGPLQEFLDHHAVLYQDIHQGE